MSIRGIERDRISLDLQLTPGGPDINISSMLSGKQDNLTLCVCGQQRSFNGQVFIPDYTMLQLGRKKWS